MLQTKSFILFIWVLISSTTVWADLRSLQGCISKGYRHLTNRHAIAAAVLDSRETRIMTFGAAKSDQIFEIGSITKTFTGNLLAQFVVAGKLKLDDPIPLEFQKTGRTIRYWHLATHTSGIIGGNFPDFNPPNPLSPYEGLTFPIFKRFYDRTPLASEPGRNWAYSNIGVGLLGIILSEKAHLPYSTLIGEKIFRVLGMRDSYFNVPPSEKYRFPEGFIVDDKIRQPLPHWNLHNTAIEPAGGIRSTITDMAIYARASLFPQTTSLSASVMLSERPIYFDKGQGFWMGMNWIVQPNESVIWHNGSTIGFESILVISKKHNTAVVAMTDTGVIQTNFDGTKTMDKSLQDTVFACLNFSKN